MYLRCIRTPSSIVVSNKQMDPSSIVVISDCAEEGLKHDDLRPAPHFDLYRQQRERSLASYRVLVSTAVAQSGGSAKIPPSVQLMLDVVRQFYRIPLERDEMEKKIAEKDSFVARMCESGLLLPNTDFVQFFDGVNDVPLPNDSVGADVVSFAASLHSGGKQQRQEPPLPPSAAGGQRNRGRGVAVAPKSSALASSGSTLTEMEKKVLACGIRYVTSRSQLDREELQKYQRELSDMTF